MIDCQNVNIIIKNYMVERNKKILIGKDVKKLVELVLLKNIKVEGNPSGKVK